MNQYKLDKKKGDGTFSEVFEANSVTTGQVVAVKCMKKKYDSIDKVKKLTEIQALKHLSPHDNIIKLIEVLYDEPTGKLALVFELMEENMYEALVHNKTLSPMKVKYYMLCLLKAIAYIHKKGIFHRDIKPENVLITGNTIKLADFGSCKGIFNKQPFTEYISTRWYRAPECLLTDGFYNHKMDIWGYGCVLFEMVSRYPLFNGKNELDQINKIHKVLGTPSQTVLDRFKVNASHMKPEDWKFQRHKGVHLSRLLPHSPKELVDLLYKLLAYDPEQRIDAEEALSHPYFSDLNETSKLERLRSTMLSFGSTSRDMKRPEKRDKSKYEDSVVIKKKEEQRESPQGIGQQPQNLPPIQNIKMDLKVNIFNQTGTSTFKKTNWGTFGKKKHH